MEKAKRMSPRKSRPRPEPGADMWTVWYPATRPADDIAAWRPFDARADGSPLILYGRRQEAVDAAQRWRVGAAIACRAWVDLDRARGVVVGRRWSWERRSAGLGPFLVFPFLVGRDGRPELAEALPRELMSTLGASWFVDGRELARGIEIPACTLHSRDGSPVRGFAHHRHTGRIIDRWKIRDGSTIALGDGPEYGRKVAAIARALRGQGIVATTVHVGTVEGDLCSVLDAVLRPPDGSDWPAYFAVDLAGDPAAAARKFGGSRGR